MASSSSYKGLKTIPDAPFSRPNYLPNVTPDLASKAIILHMRASKLQIEADGVMQRAELPLAMLGSLRSASSSRSYSDSDPAPC